MFLSSPSPSAVLAFATTMHFCLALLGRHRTGSMSAVALMGFAFASFPWLLPTPLGLALGFVVHAAWFAACERLLPRAVPRAPSAPPKAAPAPQARTPIAAKAPSAAPPAPPRPANAFVPTTVVAIFDETADIRTFRLLRPDGFAFAAGQFLSVRIRADAEDHVRCYSISSAPQVGGYLEISVKRQGVVSNALHTTVRPGSMLAVKPPAGAFRYPAGDDRPLLLLAGGIGITPLMSMLRHAIAVEPWRPVTLIYAAQRESAFAFVDELTSIAGRHPHVRIHFAARDATRPEVYGGRIDAPLLEAVVPELKHSIVFICGPAPMLDAARALLADLGVPAPQIRFEVFQAAIATAAGGEPETRPGRAPAAVGEAVTLER